MYSNELQASPKGIAPGEWIELQDASGQFLAWGVGNAHSLIAFRVVSRSFEEGKLGAGPCVHSRLAAAFTHRKRLGLGVGAGVSARLVFAESDDLSGLVIDRFVLVGGAVVFVVQAQTAAAESWVAVVLEYLAGVESAATVVIRRDAGSRKLEGLDVVAEPELARAGALQATMLASATIRVPAVSGGTLDMATNLWSGQKTGYFLDQFANIGLTAGVLARMDRMQRPGAQLRILDLFSFVGDRKSVV